MNTEIKYTKGEWKVEVRDEAILVSTNEYDIAYILYEDINDPALMPNAHLIAAAPTMLEALKALYDSLPDGYASECLPKVKKAILKAEGNITLI